MKTNIIKNLSKTTIIFLAVVFLFMAEQAKADTHTAASASYANVSAAISAASNGDIVIVPAGNVTWAASETLTFDKNITLKGNGIGSTVITKTYSSDSENWYLIKFQPTSGTLNDNAYNKFRITGFTFIGGGIYISSPSDSPMYNCTIDNNRFTDIDYSDYRKAIDIHGAWWGVIYENQFHQIKNAVALMGGDSAAWNAFTQQYGTVQNTYIEDNTFDFSETTDNANYGWVESGQGGRMVVRYNTWNCANVSANGYIWDVHGLQCGSSCQWSTMIAEIYGNKIINLSPSVELNNVRGGWTLQYFNTVNRSFSNQINQYSCDSATSPVKPQSVRNSYVFKNINTSDISGDRDWWLNSGGNCGINYNDEVFSADGSLGSGFDPPAGQEGVYLGTLAQRPSTCFEKQAYWQTNQSCANGNIANYTGTASANRQKIEGTLYKCGSSNNWIAYYTPYTYPHPLRNETITPTCTPGDANNDKSINISDVQTCINVILGTDTDSAHRTCSEMNNSPTVDITDCQAIINKILNP